MNRSITKAFAVACITVVGVCSVKLVADDKPGDKAMPADQAAMMQAMEKAGTPGPQHAELAKAVGDWDATIEDMTPGAPATTSKGTSTAKMVLGGRYLQEEFKGDMMGMPFEGMGLSGYDNTSGEYFSTWVDSMSTGIAYQTGKMVGDKLEMTGKIACPMQDKPVEMKSTLTVEGNDKRIFEMTMTMADGKLMGHVKITYTRKK